MTRAEFEHVIKAAADIVCDDIVVIGSQAILAEYPHAPAELLVSMELDVYPLSEPDRAGEIDGAIGEGSRFHETYDYYAHGVGPETPIAPAGWQERLIRIDLPAHDRTRGSVRAWCMDTHSLVLAKLAAGRPHDLTFVTTAVAAGLVDHDQLLLGVDLMPASHRELVRSRLETVIARAQGTPPH